MAERTTTYPQAPEMAAFRAVDAILRADLGLIAGGTSFRSWDGSAVDNVAISPGECPLIRISPEINQPDSGFTVSRNVAHLSIKVEIFVAGLIADDLVNMWHAIRQAMVRDKLFRGDTSVRCYLNQQAGATLSKVTMPAFGSWPPGGNNPQSNLAGVGRIEIDILVNA
jgi:hypothetical protein